MAAADGASAGLAWMRDGGGAVRLLHPLHVAEGPTGLGDPGAPDEAVVVDVETTGLGADDPIIELAMRRFRWDDAGRITAIGRRFCWLEDPGRPLTEEIVRLTGLDDAMLAGGRIDERIARRIMLDARICIAHNARFDAPRVERRLGLEGLAWACSCSEIPWRELGFDGRSLGHLLYQAGFYNGAHRASDDVDSTIALLALEVSTGRTALAELIDRSFTGTWIVRAVGAAFELKDRLKARGYRWDPDRKCWWIEVVNRQPEDRWLAANVYAAGASPKEAGPEWVPVTNRERWTA